MIRSDRDALRDKKIKNVDYSYSNRHRLLKDLLLNQYEIVGTSIFKWNIPKDFYNETKITSDRIEKYLYNYGIATIYDSDKYGFITAPLIASADLNIYFEPIQYQIMLNRYNKVLPKGTPIIFNDNTKRGCVEYVDTMLDYIIHLMIAKEMNINTLKYNTIFTGDKKLIKMLKSMIQINANYEPIALVENNIDIKKELNTFNLNTPYLCDKYDEQIKIYKDAIANFLGLKYIAVEKKERLVVNETLGDSEVFRSVLHSRLETRQTACEELNKYYGLDLSVELNDSIMLEEKAINEGIEEADNE